MAQTISRWIMRDNPFPSREGKSRSGWFAEGISPHEYHFHHVRRVIRKARTRYQDCVLADTHSFGRCLVLDGETQSSQRDEFIYHETLVHPAMLSARRPADVLIMGGGEGATAREVLKHPSVERVLMADIDGKVLDFCFQYLPSWHRGAFEHPKLRLLVEDARQLVLRTRRTFDVIVSDLPSAIRGGPAYKLYTVEFYRALRERLKPGGIFCLQAGSGQLLQVRFHAALCGTLKRVFRVVRPYYAYIPSYDVPWAFLFCSDDARLDPLARSARAVDRTIRDRGIRGLRFLDGTAFEGLFRPPLYVRDAVSRNRRVISERRPVYFFE